MNLKNILLCIMCFVISSSVYGEAPSENVKEDLKSGEIQQKQNEVEIAHLQWKLGISAFYKTIDNETTGRKDEITIYKAPLFLEFQVPFGARMKGLVQTGLGLMVTNYKKCKDEETGWKISSNKDRGTEITTFKKCSEWKEGKPVFTGYLMAQPGLQYDFGSFTGMLAGGGFMDMEKKMGFMFGLYIRGVMVKGLDIGVEMLSYNDKNYYGVSLTWGTDLKTWTR